ncbi:MAG: hypothetical protein ABI607_08585 [Betaproteobacteria bacterium]
MPVALIVLLPLLASCTLTPPPAPTAPPQPAPTQPPVTTAPPQPAPTQTPVTPAPPPSSAAPPASPTATAPAKAPAPTATAPAKAPVPSNATATAKASPAPTPKAESATADAAKPKAPTLDLNSLEQRLKTTNAIGVLTKLSLKNQVDDLLDRFRGYYQGKLKTTLAELRRSYDLLVQKVLSLLQDSDAPLATAIVASRDAIWGILSDPKKFATL